MVEVAPASEAPTSTSNHTKSTGVPLDRPIFNPETPEYSTPETPEDGVIPGRCEVFEDIEMKFMVYSMTTDDTTMTMYVRMYGGVVGYEITIPGHPENYEYHATLGDLESIKCGYEGYAERWFCYFPLHPSYHNTAQPFDLYVNGCPEPIYGHPRLSIIVPSPTPGVVADPCGPEPSTLACSSDYSDWCNCKGGTYQCWIYTWPFTGSVPICIMPP